MAIANKKMGLANKSMVTFLISFKNHTKYFSDAYLPVAFIKLFLSNKKKLFPNNKTKVLLA